MEARWHVKFTGVELASGAELAAPIEKATTGPVEKATAGPCAGEARGGRDARWNETKTGWRALARRRCRLAEQRRDGEGGAVEREARRRAPPPRWHGGTLSWGVVAVQR
jgi:hypothetical protein